MENEAKTSSGSIIPTMKYEDAARMIDWLCEAFGFHRHLVVPGENGSVIHAQLVFGNGMIMLGSARDDQFGRLQRSPKMVGGARTQSAYVIVQEIDRHYEKAVAAGAEVVIDIKDEDYGGRGYSCLDPEGHLWNFGSYDPWHAA